MLKRSSCDATTIVRFCEETDGWVAICDDDREVALTPGRLEPLQHLFPLTGPTGSADDLKDLGVVLGSHPVYPAV